MTVYALGPELIFPDPSEADDEGLLAVGGDLSPERLLLAYRSGIFPWTAEGRRIPWYSPYWRMMLRPDQLAVSRRLERTIRSGRFTVTYDLDFAAVIGACAAVPRPGQAGTWITPDMQRAYRRLHALGHAHSAEAWRDGQLVGGLYGVTVGRAFCGESMFAREPDASKVAFVTLVRALEGLGYTLIDCQVFTEHLASLGADEQPRRVYLAALQAALAETPVPPWPISTSRPTPTPDGADSP